MLFHTSETHMHTHTHLIPVLFLPSFPYSAGTFFLPHKKLSTLNTAKVSCQRFIQRFTGLALTSTSCSVDHLLFRWPVCDISKVRCMVKQTECSDWPSSVSYAIHAPPQSTAAFHSEVFVFSIQVNEYLLFIDRIEILALTFSLYAFISFVCLVLAWQCKSCMLKDICLVLKMQLQRCCSRISCTWCGHQVQQRRSLM